MSKLGRFSLWIILLGLAFIAGLRGYRAYEQQVQEQQKHEPVGQTFNGIPLQYEPPKVEMPVFKRLGPNGQPEQDIFLEDAPLSLPQAQEQARQTIRSILDDYRDDPKLKAFYAEVRQRTGADIDLAVMSSGNMGPLLKQYPQLQDVINKYAQDPQFAQTMQEIFSNPQFINSVMVLQQKPMDQK